MRKNELNFILSALCGKSAPVGNFDWYAVLGFLELNKVAGSFWNSARALRLPLPQAVSRRLSAISRSQAERGLLMRRWIRDLADELEFEGVRHAFLKGSVLSNTNFGTCGGGETSTFYLAGERISNDIDVLVRPADIGRVTKVLKNLGFCQGYYDFEGERIVELDRREILSRRMNRGETAPFLRRLDSGILPFVEIDVNFSLDYLPTGNEAMLGEFLENTCVFPMYGGGALRSLRPEYFLLHLMLHQYKEMSLYSMALRKKDLELYKLLDIQLFHARGVCDRVSFSALVERLGLERAVGAVEETVAEIFGGEKSAPGVPVLDPGTGRRFAWNLAPRDRLCRFETNVSGLEEVCDGQASKAVGGHEPKEVRRAQG